jgi:ferritin-like metal-binding protein YciE
MEKMKDLKDLLKHEIEDLMSAEQQIIEALPSMIEKAKNPQLRQALQEHLQVTEMQKTRLDKVIDALKANNGKEESKGIFNGIFGGGEKVCKGMQGLIKEGEKIISADMNPQVLDAAIIACAQKIEHYEICAYGTVRAYANELKIPEVSQLLEQTLNEEYDADDLLTSLAIGGLNQEAEDRRSGKRNGSARSATSQPSSNGRSNGSKGRSNGSKKSSSSSSSSSKSTSSSSKSKAAKTRKTRASGKRSTSKAK